MVAGPAPLHTALAFLLSLASPAQSDVWMVELARLSATADELHPTAAPAVLREAEPELGAMFGLVD